MIQVFAGLVTDGLEVLRRLPDGRWRVRCRYCGMVRAMTTHTIRIRPAGMRCRSCADTKPKTARPAPALAPGSTQLRAGRHTWWTLTGWADTAARRDTPGYRPTPKVGGDSALAMAFGTWQLSNHREKT
jgi:hypothetical protein